MATRIVSFILRVLQIIFSCGALGFMTTAKEEYDFVAFSFSLMIMALMVPWSLTLAFAQGYSDLTGYPLLRPRIIKLAIIIGDAILSFLSLAAACSAASIISYLPLLKGASSYKLTAMCAFFTWISTASSALLSFWLFHSV
ncbi:hypothetical protein MKW98_019294 [Papaver atlanticum]|uniref:CASP-like protein n=1 Tax=Papaver atlanticum TaxID=357466 RepID=A0AAD4RZR0_9MAGN|nr:hypothetical protein MKW98_017284 [Papaver atlanticum]KAI3926481.1 hypothetical protein MKW98_003834 [Papaver atlanticum]KAI3944913.1 hypothetical protein MKW98_019294 [Papaver atlanticum]